MNPRRDAPLVILAIAVLAMVFVGEAAVFTTGGGFSGDASYDGDLDYRLESGPAKSYSVLAFDDGGFAANSSVSIYYDPGYASAYEIPTVAVGARELNEEYFVEQLAKALAFRSVDAEIIDAQELEALMADGLTGNRDAVIMLSGAMPSTVYSGDNDLAVRWIQAGGRLYWAGNLLGAYSSEPDRVVPVEGGTGRFLGSECLNPSDDDYDFALSEEDAMCQTLCLQSNRVKYAVAPGLLPEGAVHRSIGFTDGSYSSTCLVGVGGGMVCILGGEFSNNQRSDLAQIVASGISHLSTLVGSAEGTVHGSYEGSLAVAGEPDFVYIQMGGYYPVFGKRIDLRVHVLFRLTLSYPAWAS